MKRPLGVTASAIFALLGSLAMIGLLVLMSVVMLFARQQQPFPREAKLGLAVSVVMFGVLGTWGIVTGIGLLRLQIGPAFQSWYSASCWLSWDWYPCL